MRKNNGRKSIVARLKEAGSKTIMLKTLRLFKLVNLFVKIVGKA